MGKKKQAQQLHNKMVETLGFNRVVQEQMLWGKMMMNFPGIEQNKDWNELIQKVDVLEPSTFGHDRLMFRLKSVYPVDTIYEQIENWVESHYGERGIHIEDVNDDDTIWVRQGGKPFGFMDITVKLATDAEETVRKVNVGATS